MSFTDVFRRREVHAFIVGFLGVLMVFSFFIKQDVLDDVATRAQSWATILYSFALILGFVSLTSLKINHVRKRQKAWSFSIVYFIAVVIWFVLFAIEGSLQGSNYVWSYNTFLGSSAVAITALTGFYVCSAAIRTFRARNIDSLLLLGTTILIMIGANASFGGAIWTGFPAISTWILNVLVMSGTRTLMISWGIGAVTMGIRVILGYEKF